MNREEYLRLRRQNAISNIVHRYINDELNRPISMENVLMFLNISLNPNNIIQESINVYDSKFNIVIVSYKDKILSIE